MIQAEDAIVSARKMLGTSYDQMDCIGLIRKVIRCTAGGETDYRCEGTNWLWNSMNNSSKYRHLIWRQEGIKGAKAGMLVFKREGNNVHHVGLVTGEGTVLHSSSVQGMVVETPLDGSWHLLGQHKLLEVKQSDAVESGDTDMKNDEAKNQNIFTSFIRSDGVSIMLAGSWRAADD